jgi:DNA-directed RNA polymerase subunit N (RpoN/RPB10)
MRKIAQQDMGNSAYVRCHQCRGIMSQKYHDYQVLMLSGNSMQQV